VLSRDEAARAGRFYQARDRRRYVVGRARLRAILGRYLGRAASQVEFRYEAHGKPVLHGGSTDARVRFNMSRAHELGVLAMQLDEELGIDIEHIRPFPDALHIAARFFTPDESDALRALRAPELEAAFFHYWTRKEAVVKSLGLGLSQPMDAFALSRHPGPAAEGITVAGADGTVTRWLVRVPTPSEGYVAALATAHPSPSLRCWFWQAP
jgi:4'-phosphopantetheinyl transferase